MVLVMLAGMLVIGGGLLLGAAAVGITRAELDAHAPALVLAGMGFSMAAPMVWWMRRRGHSWAANRAMALAMILPCAATLVLLGSGALADLHALLMVEHIVMFPAMLVAMLPFRGEFMHRQPQPAC
jgi:hypothetical protein